MKDLLLHFKKSYMLTAIFYVISGIVMLIFPNIFSRVLCYAFGAILIIFGLIDLIKRLSSGKSDGFTDFGMINGLINIGIGIFFIVKYEAVVETITFVIGMLIIVDSFIKFSKALELLKAKYKLWWITFLLALLTIGLGIWIIIDASLGFVLCGISLIVVGITDIYMIICVSRVIKKIKDALVPHAEAEQVIEINEVESSEEKTEE